MPAKKKLSEAEWLAELQFLSTTPAAMREVVEHLFFLNPQQSILIPRIKSTVEKTGVPRIVETDQRIRIAVPSGSMQCLFACNGKGKPIAVALYGRPEPGVLWISHLAVDPDFEFIEASGTGLAGIMVKKISEIARRIEGITRLQLPYRRASFLPVRRENL